jgi:hypothetical protein
VDFIPEAATSHLNNCPFSLTLIPSGQIRSLQINKPTTKKMCCQQKNLENQCEHFMWVKFSKTIDVLENNNPFLSGLFTYRTTIIEIVIYK